MFQAPLSFDMIRVEHQRRLAEAARRHRATAGSVPAVVAARRAIGAALVRWGERLAGRADGDPTAAPRLC